MCSSKFKLLLSFQYSQIHMDNLCLQTWMRLDEDYQELTRQLESVEGSIPTVGLVEETEDRLTDRIALFQVSAFQTFFMEKLDEEDI